MESDIKTLTTVTLKNENQLKYFKASVSKHIIKLDIPL